MSSCCLSCNKLDDDKPDVRGDIARVREENARLKDVNTRVEFDNVRVNDDHVNRKDEKGSTKNVKINPRKSEDFTEVESTAAATNDIIAEADDSNLANESIELVNIHTFMI